MSLKTVFLALLPPPQTTWMCYPVCYEPTEGAMTCEDCKSGIQEAVDQILSPEFMDGIVEYMQGDDFCGTIEDPECPSAVDAVIRSGLPLLAASDDPETYGPLLCNMAVEGTCPTRRIRLA